MWQWEIRACGEIGIRANFKNSSRERCRFESGQAHQSARRPTGRVARFKLGSVSVRIRPCGPIGELAQWIEQAISNRLVEGSNPSLAAKIKEEHMRQFCFHDVLFETDDIKWICDKLILYEHARTAYILAIKRGEQGKTLRAIETEFLVSYRELMDYAEGHVFRM